MLKSILQPILKPMMTSVFGGGTPWTLSDLGSDAFVFYDMNTGVTDAGSGKVSAWADSLGDPSRTITQNTGANRPDLTVDGIYFDGLNDHLFNNNPFMTNSDNGVIVIAVISAPPSLVGVSEWILCEASSSSTNPHLVILGKDSASTDLTKDTQQLRNDANSVITSYGLNPSTDDAYDDSFKILSKKYDKINNEISLRINGVDGTNPISFTPSGTFTLDRFSLGALVRGATLNYSKLTLKGLAIIDANVGLDNELRVEGYLAHLYNQTALLPSDHPYKNNPPMI